MLHWSIGGPPGVDFTAFRSRHVLGFAEVARQAECARCAVEGCALVAYSKTEIALGWKASIL